MIWGVRLGLGFRVRLRVYKGPRFRAHGSKGGRFSLVWWDLRVLIEISGLFRV